MRLCRLIVNWFLLMLPLGISAVVVSIVSKDPKILVAWGKGDEFVWE